MSPSMHDSKNSLCNSAKLKQVQHEILNISLREQVVAKLFMLECHFISFYSKLFVLQIPTNRLFRYCGVWTKLLERLSQFVDTRLQKLFLVEEPRVHPFILVIFLSMNQKGKKESRNQKMICMCGKT